MTGPPSHKPRDKPPPRREEGAPARAPTPTADGRQHGWVERTEPDQSVNTGLELLPRRPAHNAGSCSTCEQVAGLERTWRQRELRALRDRRRIIDLRDS